MLIESTVLKRSAISRMAAGSAESPLINQDDVLDTLKGLLTTCGWSEVGVYASADLEYPLSLPVVVPPAVPPGTLTPVGCGSPFVHLDGWNYVAYNPYTDTPTGTGCQFFALGTTPAATIANLANAINAVSSWVATYPLIAGVYHLHIVAALPGPRYNYRKFSGDGRFGIGGTGGTSGGGYILTSVEERDGSGNLRTASFDVRITSGGFFNGVSHHLTRPLYFEFASPYNSLGTVATTLDTWTFANFGDDLDYDPAPGVLIPAYPSRHIICGASHEGYTLLANPYSFAIYCPSDDAATSIFAAAPYIPTEEQFTTAYSFFVANNVQGATSWNGGLICLDGAPEQVFGFARPRMLAVRSPGTIPLTTPSGAPLVTNAWVMYGRNRLDGAAVVGKLWDCAMVSGLVDGTTIAGKHYLRLAKQPGTGGLTASTLLFCTDQS